MKRVKRTSGQVAVEFVIMLAFILLVFLAVKYLGGAMSNQGERMVRVAAYNVP